jgi:hypothetical protein
LHWASLAGHCPPTGDGVEGLAAATPWLDATATPLWRPSAGAIRVSTSAAAPINQAPPRHLFTTERLSAPIPDCPVAPSLRT